MVQRARSLLASLALALLLTGAVGFAQAPSVVVAPPGSELVVDTVPDPTTPLGMVIGIVFGITALVKGSFKLHDGATLVVSFIAGQLAALLVSLSAGDFVLAEAVTLGLSASIFASGGREGLLVMIHKAASWISPSVKVQPITGDTPKASVKR